MSRLRAGELRGGVGGGKAGSAAPPLSVARLAGPRGVPRGAAAAWGAGAGWVGGSGAELRAARAAFSSGARAALPALQSSVPCP